MERAYLEEAFNAIKLLEEEAFNFDEDGLADSEEFVESDVDDTTIDILDADVEDEEDLKDTYVGNVVLDCVVCHTPMFKKLDELKVSDEGDIVNVGEPCPICKSEDGYNILGKIVPYEEEPELKLEVEPKNKDKSDTEEKPEISAKKTVDKYDSKVKENYENILKDNLDIKKQKSKEAQQNTNSVIREGFDKIEIETEDEIFRVTEEPKTNSSEGDMMVPVEEPKIEEPEEANDEIMDSNLESAEVDETESEDIEAEEEFGESLNMKRDKFINLKVEDISENRFNRLIENYFKKNYRNVDSFELTDAQRNDRTLVLEGIIKFNSGKVKKTQFILEADSATKDGKITFIGENKQLSRGKKTFVLKGQLLNGKILAESLQYNYRHKLQEGKSVPIRGSVTLKNSGRLQDFQRRHLVEKKTTPISEGTPETILKKNSAPVKGGKDAKALNRRPVAIKGEKGKSVLNRNTTPVKEGKDAKVLNRKPVAKASTVKEGKNNSVLKKRPCAVKEDKSKAVLKKRPCSEAACVKEGKKEPVLKKRPCAGADCVKEGMKKSVLKKRPCAEKYSMRKSAIR